MDKKKSSPRAERREFAENPDYYRGVELAPSTIESLVTWDVSGHARLEQGRLNSAYRRRDTIHGGY